MRTLEMFFVAAAVGASVAAFGHTIPGFNHEHEGGETTTKKALPREKACMLYSPTAGDLEAKLKKLGCQKGDIITIWYVSQLPRTMKRVPATASRICDYRDTTFYRTPFGGTGMQWSSCFYVGYVREISMDKESGRGTQ